MASGGRSSYLTGETEPPRSATMKPWKMTTPFLCAASLLIAAPASLADPAHDEGLWLMIAAQGSFDEEDPEPSRLRWWFDGHARFFEDANGYGQSIVRPGMGYAIGKRSTLWAGYGWIRTSPANGQDVDEHRIWQQWTTSIAISSANLSWRSRLEQRFVEGGDDVGWRFRQFIKVSQPIAFQSRLRLVAYDEVFIALNNADWGARSGFDQNRLFAGLGWQFHEGRNVEVGYLNQFVQRSGQEDLMNHILSLNLLLRF